MKQKSGCLICGAELVYSDTSRELTCFYCGEKFQSNASCRNGHFVCDHCHGHSANDLIERYCTKSKAIDPLTMALELMHSPLVHIHGPEHHYLVPAVLLAAWHNQGVEPHGELAKQLAQARKRAESVPGGACGFQGVCGAAVGTGIFLSVITESTPMSTESWRMCNQMTAESLAVIAAHGGPRCCKRVSFWAILTAVEFMRKHYGANWHVEQPECCFSAYNKECQHNECVFYHPPRGPERFKLKTSATNAKMSVVGKHR
jgi:hypothetical protein